MFQSLRRKKKKKILKYIALYKDQISAKNKVDFISFEKILEKEFPLLINIDSSGSVIQIASIISFDSSLIKKCNLICTDGSFNDTYTNLVPIPSQGDCDSKPALNLMTRSMLKMIVITSFFGSYRNSVISRLSFDFDLNEEQSIVITDYVFSYFIEPLEAVDSFFKKLLADYLKELEENPSAPFILKLPLFTTHFCYNKQKETEVSFEGITTNEFKGVINKAFSKEFSDDYKSPVKKIKVILFFGESTVNIKKHSISFKANICHALDAHVILRVSQILSDRSISFYVVHDIFCVEAAYADDIVSFYNEACVELVYWTLSNHSKFFKEDSTLFASSIIKQIKKAPYSISPFLFILLSNSIRVE